MRRDPGAVRSGYPYPPFGFDERLDMPPRLRDVGLKYFEPDQCHSIAELFFVPWAYLGHPSQYQLKPLEQVLLPRVTEEEVKAIEEAVVPGMSEDELRDIFEKYKPKEPAFKESGFWSRQYKRDKTLPPGLLLYGANDSGYGARD